VQTLATVLLQLQLYQSRSLKFRSNVSVFVPTERILDVPADC